ncbi:hypothetical protein VKT23_016329 [Stygiomarasmius scandens]|uniref:DUF6534 domain-containing protein n=1 Tax=Marasmiellus scandens TaxID=2682957 RepID=A0ABR1IZR1_9AGAR
MTGIIVAQVQLFFAWRVQVLADSYVLAFLAAIPSIVGCFASLMSAIYVKKYPRIYDFGHIRARVDSDMASIGDNIGFDYHRCFGVLLGKAIISFAKFQASTDDVQHRNKQGFRSTDEVVDRVIRLTVQTGMATSVVAIIDVVLYLVLPTSAIHLLFNLPLNKIYSVMLMNNLNSRHGWAYEVDSSNIEQNSRDQSGGAFVSRIGFPSSETLAVHVEEHEMSDYGSQTNSEKDMPMPSPVYQQTREVRFVSPIFKFR